MTEYWVSQSKHWCEYCKCWMSDTPNARAAHERGVGHQTAVQRRLREMRLKEIADKKEEENLKKSLKQIESAAEKAYAKDLEAQGEDAEPLPPPSHPPPTLFGSWEPQEGSEYLYNAKVRFYFDVKTGFYFGGDPPTWTQAPDMPAEAKYKSPQDASTSANPAVAGTTTKKIIRVTKPHPLQGIGGYSIPVQGTMGADRGISSKAAGSASASSPATLGKRERPEGKPISDEEKVELEQREAARKRVQARTMANFGLS